MASLTKDRRIQFKAPDGKRKTIRLGKIPIKQARVIQRHVERLVSCRLDGSAPPEETGRWAAGINNTLQDRLVRVGLLQPNAYATTYTLGQLVDDFKARPKWKSIKPNTRKNYLMAFGYMTDYFGLDKLIQSINFADAEDFYGHLRLSKDDGGKGFAVATVNGVAAIGFALLNYAVDSERLNRNPFKGLSRSPRKGNNTMVSEADSELVLEQITDTQERLMFGLSRWGGLRVPSEPIRLRWADIDWEKERFLVHSPKTERHEGRETRWIPIFPELAKLFDARYTEAAEGDEYVLPAYRVHASSRAAHMLRVAIKRAGIDLWPRLWHSLRSTRQTELVERFPVHVVCSWLGNTIDVAATHYLKMTEQHFEAATKATHKATHPVPVTGSTNMKKQIAGKQAT